MMAHDDTDDFVVLTILSNPLAFSLTLQETSHEIFSTSSDTCR